MRPRQLESCLGPLQSGDRLLQRVERLVSGLGYSATPQRDTQPDWHIEQLGQRNFLVNQATRAFMVTGEVRDLCRLS
jgi:hypothetical protein